MTILSALGGSSLILTDLLAETIRIRDRIATWPASDVRTMRLAGCARDIARLREQVSA